MGLLSVLLAAAFIAVSNLFMRRGIDAGGTSRGYLMIQMISAFFLSVLIGPVKTGSYAINGPIALLGLCAGVALALLLVALGKALERGPPGLTFSILNGAAVFPGVVMAMLFGAAFGYVYTVWHGIGSILVLGGLFWAGRGMEGLKDRKWWLIFSVVMFFSHVMLLVIFQWRALLLNTPNPEELASFFSAEQIQSQWFAPMFYLSAALIQIAIYFKNEKGVPIRSVWLNGIGGGVTNGLCSFFLIQGTVLATGLENAIIFPLYSIGSIVFSNIWSQRLYQEKINWRAAQVCALGLFVGTVDWKAVVAALNF